MLGPNESWTLYHTDLFRLFFIEFQMMLPSSCNHLYDFLAHSASCENFFVQSVVFIRLFWSSSTRWWHGSKTIIILHWILLKLFGFAMMPSVSSSMVCILMVFYITSMFPTVMRSFIINLLNLMKLNLEKLQYILAIALQWIPTNWQRIWDTGTNSDDWLQTSLNSYALVLVGRAWGEKLLASDYDLCRNMIGNLRY